MQHLKEMKAKIQMGTSNVTRFLLLGVALLAGYVAGLAMEPAPAAATPREQLNLSLRQFVSGGQIFQPTVVTNAGDERLFVVERSGRIRVVQPDGAVELIAFLDIDDRVAWQDDFEQGLLGLAFHPNYQANGYFYLNYTALPDGNSRISRFQVTADPNVADPGSEVVLLEVPQANVHHNGGQLAFGPEGMLYIAFGDGGFRTNAQDGQSLLGKILRIDVDGGPPYSIPPDNPFVGNPGFRDEIWALGFRNPWRFSFDRMTGDLWIGEVGEAAWEEVDFQPAGAVGGANYGWPCYEGFEPFHACNPMPFHTPPVFAYSHAPENPGEPSRCAITGGYVYRGSRYPEMFGRYFFADYCAGYIWDMDGPQGPVTRHFEGQQFVGYSTFGQSAGGELYLAEIFSGVIYRMTEDTFEGIPVFIPLAVR